MNNQPPKIFDILPPQKQKIEYNLSPKKTGKTSVGNVRKEKRFQALFSQEIPDTFIFFDNNIRFGFAISSGEN